MSILGMTKARLKREQQMKNLNFEVSSRGFMHMETVSGDYPDPWNVRVYESSAAEDPAIWLAMDAGNHAHLTLKQAEQLRDQLEFLINNHYQVR